MPDAVASWAQSLWPTGDRELLLQALFHRDEDVARQAWLDWEAAIDFDDVTWSDIRILPAMGRRWTMLGITSGNAARIEGMRRFGWARVQMCLQKASPVLAALADAGVPVLVIKGSARALSSLPHGAERISNDVDIVVQRRHLERALDAVERSGWTSSWDISPAEAHRLLRASRHSLPYRPDDQDFEVLDIHASALFSNRCLDHDDTLWSRSTLVRFRGSPVHVPHPADQLIIACVHGLFFEQDPKPMDWVADCVDVLDAPAVRQDASFWDTVMSEAQRRELLPNLYAGLSFLRARLGQRVPDDVLAALSSNSRQPFIDECIGCAAGVEAHTPEIRAAWGAAFIERSVSSAARLGQVAEPDDPDPASADRAAWRGVGAVDEHRLEVAAPPDDMVRAAIAAGRPLMLEVRGPLFGGREVIRRELALLAMEMHVVELARATLSRRRFATRPTAAFEVRPSLFLAYDLDQLFIEVTDAGSLAPIAVGDDNGRLFFRWKLSNVAGK